MFRAFNAASAGNRAGKVRLWKVSPEHPSIRFEERRNGICVVRIGNHYRAVGLREGNVIAWFWIGTHEEYNNFGF